MMAMENPISFVGCGTAEEEEFPSTALCIYGAKNSDEGGMNEVTKARRLLTMLIKVRSCNLKLEEQMHASYTNYNFTIEKCNASIYADSLELCLTEKGSNGFLI